jgi:hypothetical protein
MKASMSKGLTPFRNSGQRKAVVTVHAGLEHPMEPDGKWHSEEGKRLRDKASALEKELESFDENGAAQKVKSALSLELERVKLDQKRHELSKR